MKKISLLEKIISAIFPPRCPLCKSNIQMVGFCEKCKAKMPNKPIVRVFEISENRKLKCVAPVFYKDSYRKLVHKFKFEGRHSLARPLAQQMCESLKNIDVDVVTFVPMSNKAKAERGYNQSEKLAKYVGKRFSVPLKSLLKKTGKNQRQHDLNALERIENVKNVFAVCQTVKGLNILLVDDIVTTGATLAACAEELYKYGAKNVDCVCFASTPLD